MKSMIRSILPAALLLLASAGMPSAQEEPHYIVGISLGVG